MLKKFKYFEERKAITNVVSVIISVIIYSLLIQYLILIVTNIPQKKFDKTKWINNPTERYKMVNNLVESDYLIGKNKDTIISIFGKPIKQNHQTNTMSYEFIGQTWADFKIIKLELYIKNDTVSKTEIIE